MESPQPKKRNDKCDEIDNDNFELEFYDLKNIDEDVYELTETLDDEKKVDNLESIETNLNLDLFEKWMVKIFPRSKINFWKVSEDDNISNEATYARLITILLFITVVSCFITFGQLIWISRPLIVPQPFIPKINDPFCK